jgi:pSer/pThr/pTyr-binding forkhead associated (FHA) protein
VKIALGVRLLEVEVLVPNQAVRSYDVADDSFIIGRGKSSRVQIDSDNISRSHLKVVCLGDDIHLQDFTTSNWVSYNGKKLDKEQAVQYTEGSICMLPGDIQVKFSRKEGTRIDQVKHELTMINFNMKKILSKTVQDEISDIEKK